MNPRSSAWSCTAHAPHCCPFGVVVSPSGELRRGSCGRAASVPYPQLLTPPAACLRVLGTDPLHRARAVTMFEKLVVIDCKNHLMGRLASIVAKEMLSGQKIVCVRCEHINISGSFYRNKLKFLDKLRKRTNTNPAHGPYHHRAPARIFHRVIRGMIPHKTHRGKCAMERLKCFEGIPEEYATKKRVVVPDAFRVTRLKPGRRFCVLGRISNEIGWKHGDTVLRLEKKREQKASAYWAEKVKLEKKAIAVAAKHPGDKVLAQFGY